MRIALLFETFAYWFETNTNLEGNLGRAIASYSFQGKTIPIADCAGDIGKATAHRFAENGAGIVLLNVNEAKMTEVARELEKHQTPIHTFRCDVIKPDEIKRVFVDTTKQVLLDYVFNNAGDRGAFAKTAEYPDDDFQKAIDINLVARQ